MRSNISVLNLIHGVFDGFALCSKQLTSFHFPRRHNLKTMKNIFGLLPLSGSWYKKNVISDQEIYSRSRLNPFSKFYKVTHFREIKDSTS